jgi:glycosyltransferase involved in cell wall biosynthesis
MRRSRKVVAISHFVADRAVDAGVDPEKVLVIHSLAPSRIERKERGAGTNLRAGSDRLVYVGSLAEHKGLIPLVEAFTKLATELPALKLDIVGGSQYDAGFRDRLISMLIERSLSKRVSLHGHVDDPSDYFRRAAVHVVPSICEEGLGNVVLEAKREGTPSVVFPSGGLVETVRHKIDGYVCRDKTADELAEAVRWLLADETRLHGLGAAARDDFDARFGEARFRHAWADIYRLASTGDAA